MPAKLKTADMWIVVCDEHGVVQVASSKKTSLDRAEAHNYLQHSGKKAEEAETFGEAILGISLDGEDKDA